MPLRGLSFSLSISLEHSQIFRGYYLKKRNSFSYLSIEWFDMENDTVGTSERYNRNFTSSQIKIGVQNLDGNRKCLYVSLQIQIFPHYSSGLYILLPKPLKSSHNYLTKRHTTKNNNFCWHWTIFITKPV